MAVISPSGIPDLRLDAGWYSEIEVLRHLQDALTDDYEIFHSVSWHSVHEGTDRHGEIDIVVLGPNGNVLLAEIKAGDVLLKEGELFKLYQGREHNVGSQCRVQYAAMVNRFKEAGLHPFVTNCLILPDYKITQGHAVTIPRERIIDAEDYLVLGTRIRQMLEAGRSSCDRERVRQFLANQFRVSPDLLAFKSRLRHTTQKLADGLATWVPRIEAPSRVVRICATAGSGKTQLAVRLLQDAAEAGQHSLYVCFNRTLADHMAKIAPTRAQVSNFHDLCVEHYRRVAGDPDFADPAVFAAVVARFVADSEHFAAKWDVLVIDEGQDFEPDWVQSLCSWLTPDGHFYLLEDADQQLYQRAAFDLPDAVQITCHDNFRSPQRICQLIDALGLASVPIQSRSPHAGDIPAIHPYASERQLVEQTTRAIKALLADGFAAEDIVVLTGRGIKKSALLQLDTIAGLATRRFTGHYSDRTGWPEWTDGPLLVESIYRYKGQASPAVVLAEIDFSELTPLERKKLFVGLTRASITAALVISEASEQCLARLLSM